jgi:hypothetical protein
MELRKPDTCPRCSASKIQPIVYGLVMGEGLEAARRGEIVLGGCIVGENMPVWRCVACRHRWYDETDPAWQARERFFRRLVGYPENAPPLGEDVVEQGGEADRENQRPA